MQPVKIIIKGNYYDCQIYRGRLYLWTFDGTLKVYNWDDMVRSFLKKDTDEIPIKFCFLNGSLLYKQPLAELFKKDIDFKKLLIKKIDGIAKRKFQLSEKQVSKFLLGEQGTPTGILPIDTEIYSNQLYFIHEKGLYSGPVHRESRKFPVSLKPKKLWDCNLLSIKANKYPQLALSGGSEGLFELNMVDSIILPDNIERIEKQNPIFQVSKNHSSFANYSFLSIYSTSFVETSFLSLFKWDKRENGDNHKPLRIFDEEIDDQKIFEEKNKQHFISWGIEDKIYKVTKDEIKVIKFNNYANPEKEEKNFKKLESINLDIDKGEVISGGTAYFGNIIEYENALVIIQSDGGYFTIPESVTRWRIYPRSLNYENHLHVILDDRIEIYSFNHDYFLTQQEEKKVGIIYDSERHRKRESIWNTQTKVG